MLANCFPRVPLGERRCEPGRLRRAGGGGGVRCGEGQHSGPWRRCPCAPRSGLHGRRSVDAAAEGGRREGEKRGRGEGEKGGREGGRRPREECGCEIGREGRPVASCFLTERRSWRGKRVGAGSRVTGLAGPMAALLPPVHAFTHTHTRSRVPGGLGAPAQGDGRETLCLLSRALFGKPAFFFFST